MSSRKDLNGKVVIVTGAARGIGAAICQALSEASATVVAADILDDDVKLTADRLGDQVKARSLDVTDERAWAKLVGKVQHEYGRIDGLVNNAGILGFATLENTDPADFRRIFEVNVTGTFLGIRAVAPVMRTAGSGCIVNVSSSSAILPNNATGAYAASKFAIRGLTRTAALELAPGGVRVNSIHPGGVNTPMTNPQGIPSEQLNTRYGFVPQGRGSEPKEIAAVVRFLLSDEASYCNGAEIVVDGGLTAGQYFYGLPGAPELSS